MGKLFLRLGALLWNSMFLTSVISDHEIRVKNKVYQLQLLFSYYTPPKTNMESQNRGLEKDFPCERGDFPVPC